MSKYVLINDIHLSDRAPSSCTDTYLDDLFDLLGGVRTYAHIEGAKAIILAGDVFHHKTPSRTSHATVMRLIDWARSCRCPVYTVLGNHDLLHDRISSIAETQPLGVCIASGAIRLLDGWIDDGALIYGVPWLGHFDDDTVRDALADWRRAVTRDEPALVVTHAPLYPPGMELPYENYPATRWARAMNNCGTVHYGHVHEAHGVYTVDGVQFSNCGALSRGSLHEHNLTRTPAVAVWDSASGAIEHVLLPAKPAEQVFRLAEAGEAKATRLELDGFLTSVGQTRLEITSSEAVMSAVRDRVPDDAVVALVQELLDAAADR